jgi:hypothetical protein
MGFFKDWRSHYVVGFAYGLTLRVLPKVKAEQKIVELDIWSFNREVRQHDPDLTPHQIQEAQAWGKGARAARGLNPPLPVPPYPLHA